jgi:CRP-like cAMP-binding protein
MLKTMEIIKNEQEINLILYKYCLPEWHPIINHYLKTRGFVKNEHIFSEGQEVRNMKFIKSGKVKVVSKEGAKEKIIRFAAEGDILGHRGLGSEAGYPVSAIALTNVQIYLLPVNIFHLLMKANNEFSFYLINLFAEELRKAEQETKVMVNYTVKQRIARAILYAAKVFGFTDDNITLSFTPSRKDFANLAGTTYETVIRSLSELQDEKLIQSSGKEIMLLNKEGLKSLLN